MIELVIAALISISSITTDPSSTQSVENGSEATPTTSTVDGGTGNWDDNQ